jgi:hypothetical protein
VKTVIHPVWQAQLSAFPPAQQVDLGPAWAGNSVNACALRQSGLISRGPLVYASFYEPDAKLAVVQIDLSTGRSQRVMVPQTIMPWDAHRAISMALDRRGCLHLAWGAHNSTLLYLRSRSGNIQEGLDDVQTLVGTSGGLTYPIFIAQPLGNDPLLLLREGSFASSAWHVWRRDPSIQTWVKDQTPVLEGRASEPWSSGPYLDKPTVALDGRIDLTYCWRLAPEASDRGLVANVGIDHLTSADGLQTVGTASGAKLTLPVTPASTNRIWAVSLDAGLMNQCCLAAGPDGRLFLASLWSDPGANLPQYRLLWQDGPAWRQARLSSFKTCFSLSGAGTLPTPHARPQLLVDPTGRCHLIFRSAEFGGRLVLATFSPPDYDLAAATFRLFWDEDLGFYEPVLDHDAWRDSGLLVLYVQRCNQPANADRQHTPTEADARLLLWTRDQL